MAKSKTQKTAPSNKRAPKEKEALGLEARVEAEALEESEAREGQTELPSEPEIVIRDEYIKSITFTTPFASRKHRAVARYNRDAADWRTWQVSTDGNEVILLDRAAKRVPIEPGRPQLHPVQYLYRIPKSSCIIEYEVPVEETPQEASEEQADAA